MFRKFVQMALALVLGAGLSLGAASPALAWGTTGHRLIARLALDNVRPETRAAIAQLMKADPELGTPKCRIDDLEDASTWPDCVRLERWRWGYSAEWHQQNAPICAQAFDPNANCPNGLCVTAAIARAARILADKTLPAPQRLEALAFLTHFVGDIHMPMHVSDLDHNYGGNLIEVSNYPPGPIVVPAKPEAIVVRKELKPISLHWFWDDTLVNILMEKGDGKAIVHPYRAEDRARIATGGVNDWARESWDLARGLVYPQAFGRDPCVGEQPKSVAIADAAVAADLPVVRERLTQAGLRLAKMLDEALGG